MNAKCEEEVPKLEGFACTPPLSETLKLWDFLQRRCACAKSKNGCELGSATGTVARTGVARLTRKGVDLCAEVFGPQISEKVLVDNVETSVEQLEPSTSVT